METTIIIVSITSVIISTIVLRKVIVIEKRIMHKNDAYNNFPGYEDNIDDELYKEIEKAVIKEDKCSTSWLQRKFRIGYARSAKIMDLLEENGVIEEYNGDSPRKVLS